MNRDIVIVGAGLAGLSAARALRNSAPLVLEKEARVGGLAASKHVDGFTFDYSGHLLHVNSARIRRLVDTLLPGALRAVTRRAGILMEGRLIDYPFQANIRFLSKPQQKECLLGLIETAGTALSRGEREGLSFHDWLLACFGRGIFRLFMEPYNRKLFQTDLRRLSSEWTGWAIPRPPLEEVIDQLLGIRKHDYGYNTTFLYPKRGGIELLPQALARGVREIRLGAEVTRIDVPARRLTLKSGEQIRYERLISTMPLKALVGLSRGVPPEIRRAGRGLKHVSVRVVNLGLRRKPATRKHWFYIPEARFTPYRVGLYANFAPRTVPVGCGSAYVEIARGAGTRLARDQAKRAAIALLREMGMLGSARDVVVHDQLDIPCAYVIHDRERRTNLPALQAYYRQNGIFLAGRYGLWSYMGMAETMESGMKAAREAGAQTP
ncbi:MAG: FAD-dependent oxidoreductase [Kiritimatiellae bacterium]|nr:FAD-dependent oxidoreductase [Kiritimatiellia bacterium]